MPIPPASRLKSTLPFLLLLFSHTFASAATATLTPHELFRIPFGASKETLGTRVDQGEMKIPSNFTIDRAGRFYIYDNQRHRIARFSSTGIFEIGYTYADTVRQVFAYADERQNLWLLMSEPRRGLFYGVYDNRGKEIHAGQFRQFNRFALRISDGGLLRAILSSDQRANSSQMYWFDQDSLLMKKDPAGIPPEDFHRVRQGNSIYFVQTLPGSSGSTAAPRQRITDIAQQPVADIEGVVLYLTSNGEIYTRVGTNEIRVYSATGRLQNRVRMPGLASSLNNLRFDSEGHIYQLDGIPDASGAYDSAMPGMRLIRWDR